MPYPRRLCRVIPYLQLLYSPIFCLINMIYLLVKYILKQQLFRVVLNVFFQEIETIGQHKTPSTGPLIICGNHSNQFLDPALIVSNCGRKVSFLMAASSFKKRIIGTLGRCLGAIPVKRPQDYAISGIGKITSDNTLVTGVETRFTEQVRPGDQLKYGDKLGMVKAVISDNQIELRSPINHEELVEFKVIPKIDQQDVYDAVQDGLYQGRCIGIFPEGGSHDRTELLPLKAGICLMALGAMARYNITVSIQCVGLNYYSGHRFRSRAVVNFGTPFKIPRNLAELYLQDRGRAIQVLLEMIEQRLKNVWITAPSYEELNTVFMARRLYKPDNIGEDSTLDFTLNRNFAKGYRYIRENHPDSPVLLETMKSVEQYSNSLRRLGLRDDQIKDKEIGMFKWIYYAVYSITMFLLSITVFLPGLLFNGIIGIFLRTKAEQERVRALAGSSVKITGRDVLASYKVVYGVVTVPIGLGVIGLALFFYEFCKSYSDNTGDFWEALNMIYWFGIISPIYYYSCILFAGKAAHHFRLIHFRALSVCTPTYIKLLRQQREIAQSNVRKLVDVYAKEIFPGLEVGKVFKLHNQNIGALIGDSFTILSEIGL